MSCQNELRRSMRSRGLRMTLQREWVLETVHHCSQPATAQEILCKVQSVDPQAEKTTIYRTLALLERFGLITSFDAGGDCRSYIFNRGRDRKPTLVCRLCGKTVKMDSPSFQYALFKEIKAAGFQLDTKGIIIPCECQQCRKQSKKSSS